MRQIPGKIEDESWDFLIVLDACRFDYFAQTYGNYLRGNLSKRLSLGSNTPDWFANSFTRKHPDTVYVSANPFINGLSDSKLGAAQLFHKVIDVWDICWSEELGAVHPQEVNRVVKGAIEKFPSFRFVVHYLQPHAPYISEQFRKRGFLKPKMDGQRSNPNLFMLGESGYLSRRLCHYADSLGAGLTRAGILDCEWALRDMLHLPPAGPMDVTRRIYGREGLRMAYQENLRIVLQYVSELCGYLAGKTSAKKIVITSDHGERLGEGGQYSHKAGSNDPLLREVPWLEVQ
jgi:hypothetical protein